MKNFFINIKIIIFKYSKYSGLIVSLLVFGFLVVVDSLGDNIIKNTLTTQSKDKLFDDIEFVFNLNDNNYERNAGFIYPCNSINISTNPNQLVYKCDGIVMAMSNGMVKSMGIDEDNNRYLVLAHNEGYVTHYAGIEYFGVVIGERVGAGMVIATCNSLINMSVTIYKNNTQQKVVDIIWEK